MINVLITSRYFLDRFSTGVSCSVHSVVVPCITREQAEGTIKAVQEAQLKREKSADPSLNQTAIILG